MTPEPTVKWSEETLYARQTVSCKVCSWNPAFTRKVVKKACNTTLIARLSNTSVKKNTLRHLRYWQCQGHWPHCEKSLGYSGRFVGSLLYPEHGQTLSTGMRLMGPVTGTTRTLWWSSPAEGLVFRMQHTTVVLWRDEDEKCEIDFHRCTNYV